MLSHRVIAVALLIFLVENGAGCGQPAHSSSAPSVPDSSAVTEPSAPPDVPLADRGVYALVVGVSKYDDGNLTHATPNAKAFADMIKTCYSNVDLRYLTDQAATTDSITAAFNEGFASAPPDSLIIFYFAGHGERESSGNGSHLYLRLSKTTHQNYKNHAILFDSLVPYMLLSPRSTAMIVLDCCFSGEAWSPSDDLETRFKQARVRAFMLSASSAGEVAVNGIFTEALLKTWSKAKGQPDACWTPAILFNHTIEEMKTLKGYETMTPQLVFGQNLNRCVADLGLPSTLLVFTFPKGCRYPVKFHFQPSGHEEAYDPAREPDFLTQIAKSTATIKVTATLGEGPQVIWSTELAPQDKKKDVVEVPVTFSEDRFNNPDNKAAYSSMAATADAVRDYGSNPAEFYYRTAELALAAFPDSDPNQFTTLALKYDPNNLVYRIAVESAKPLPNSMGTRVRPAELASFLSSGQHEAILNKLEAVGAFTAVAELRDQLANRSKDVEYRKFQLYRAAVCAKAAGNDKVTEQLAGKLAGLGLTSAQAELLVGVRDATVADIRLTPQVWLNSQAFSILNADVLPNRGSGVASATYVESATKALEAAGNFSWEETTENTRSRNGGPESRAVSTQQGKMGEDGLTQVDLSSGALHITYFGKGDKVVLQNEAGEWVSAEEMTASNGGFARAQLANLQTPAMAINQIVSKVRDFKREGDAYIGEIVGRDASDLLMPRRPGRNGGPPQAISAAKVNVRVWIKDGVVYKFQTDATGTLVVNGQDLKIGRTATVQFKDIGTTNVHLPADAKKKLD